jgi:hypothetical protein
MTPNEKIGSVVTILAIVALVAVVLWDRRHWRCDR